MKNIKPYWFLIIILTLLFSGCNTQTNPEDRDIDIIKEEINNEYTISTLIEDPSNIYPAGIIFHSDKLLICNQKNNCISIYDLNGQKLQDIGTLGNGPLEFNKPTGITLDDSFYYIIDANNHRIQVIDHNFTYIKEIPIPNFADQNFSYFFDIAVGNEQIFLSSNAMKPDASKLISIVDNAIVDISKDFIGFISYNDDKLYAIDYLELFRNGKNNTAVSGKSDFFILNNNKLVQSASLPYKNTFMDFLVYNDLLYCINGAFHRLDVYDQSGNYIETLAKFPEHDVNSQYIMMYNDEFYITITEHGIVYKVSQNS